MSRQKPAATEPLWKDYELDIWRWRLQTLEDLAEFETKHGPTSVEPLPTLNWELDTTREVCADLPNREPQSQAVLAAFAAVLDTTVQARHLTGTVIYSVHGRIGKPEGTNHIPRTALMLRTYFFQDDEESEHQPTQPSKPGTQGRTA